MADAQVFFDYINEGIRPRRCHSTGGSHAGGKTITNALVKVPLKTLNRHGLIAGATGTGKPRPFQVLAENLSEKGIPVLLMDIKGDLSGLAQPSPGHPKIDERHAQIRFLLKPKTSPLKFSHFPNRTEWLRATVSEFGPVLISRILELSEAQSGVMSILFKYCDDNKLPLLDLKGFEENTPVCFRWRKRRHREVLRKDIARYLWFHPPKDRGVGTTGGWSFLVKNLLILMIYCGSTKTGGIHQHCSVDRHPRPTKTIFDLHAVPFGRNLCHVPRTGWRGRPQLVIFIDEAI